jgi:serine/threonine protein kinase/DNA-binding winged helix-turn-helix (wHTH) protein
MSAAERSAAPAEDAARWRIGDNVLLDEAALELSVGGLKAELRRKPLELLMFFVRNPGEVVTKDELFEAVWPGRIVSENSLSNAIGLLRNALGDQDQQIVKAVYGYGYRFTATVVREDAPRAAAAPPASFDFQPGAPVPHRAEWSFEAALGGGGYGEVWLAEHRATRDKRVFKFARDAASLVSLKREITLFRLMRDSLGERPDRVTLLDWNLELEPYFIGQEWCTGGSLLQWADSLGGIGRLDLPARLELIAQVADALAAAHSLGVLHKDLKPANLLVQLGADRKPVMKLADFGSARLIGGDHLASMNITRMGFSQTIADSATGTPLYMAPEVLGGHAPTIQSDLYALGVILYQVVVGNLRKPLAPGWERGIDDELLREDIAECAAGDPQQRLVDAADLAQRLRSLDARRSQRQRERAEQQRAAAALKQLDRARARRGLLWALAATLMIGFVTSSWLLWRSNQSEKKAVAEAARASAVTSFLTDDLLSATNPLISGRRDVSMRAVIDDAAGKLDRFAGQPHLLGTLQRVLGTTYAAMNEREPAEKLLAAAEATLTQQLGPVAPETQAARDALVQMYLDMTELGGLAKVLARTSELQAAANDPDVPAALFARGFMAAATCFKQFVYLDVARCDEPIDQSYRSALERFGPDNAVTLQLQWLSGALRFRTRRYADALQQLRPAYQGLRRLHGAGNIQVLEIQTMISQSLIQTGQVEEGLPLNEQALATLLTIHEPTQHYVLVVRRDIAGAKIKLGAFQAALSELQVLRLDWLKAPNTGQAVGYAETTLLMADALDHLHRPAEAQAALEDALSRLDARTYGGPFFAILLRDRIADLRLQLGDAAQTESLLRQNLADARATMKRGEWLLGWCAYRLADFLAVHGHRDEALPLLAEAVPILDSTMGAQHPRSQLASAALSRYR